MTHEQHSPGGEWDAGLSALFAAYREACPDPEPGPGFMPGLWQRIEARQSYTYSFKRLAQAIITAALAVCLLMAAYWTRPAIRQSAIANHTYLELLAADQNRDSLADAEIIQAVHERAR